MFRFWVCCLIIFFSHFTNLSFASADFEELKQILDEKKYSEALIEIQRLRQQPGYTDSPELIYNLALSEWSLEQYGSALAHFRQSFYAKPSIKSHKTLSWATKNLEDIQNSPVRTDPVTYKLSHIMPSLAFFVFSLVLLLPGIYFALRKSPSLPRRLRWCGLSIVISALFFSTSFYAQKLRKQNFATQILNESISAFSGPSHQAANIGLIMPGDAVQILRSDNKWLQIKTSDLPSAWVESSGFKIHNRLIDPKLPKP